MKIAFFADTQADIYYDGFTDKKNKENTRFNDSLDIFNQIRNSAVENNCEYVIFGGDLHERKDPCPFVRNKVNETIKEQTAIDQNLKWILIPGNHDQDTKSVLSDDSLRTLTIFSNSMPNVEVVHEYKQYKLGNVIMYCFAHGWFSKETFDNMLNNIKEKYSDKTIVLVFHENINGAKMASGMEIKSSNISKSDLSELSKVVNGRLIVLAGHIHNQQIFSKEYLGGYVGCPLQITQDDEGESKGWWIVDTEKLDLKFFKSKSPEICTFEFDTIKQLHSHTFNNDIDNNIVRIYVRGDKEDFKDFDQEAYKDTLFEKHKIRALKIQKLPPTIETEDIEIPAIIKTQSVTEDMIGYVNSGYIKGIDNVTSSELLEFGYNIIK